ncbi:MAG: hypothetical protein DMD81_13010 [Candidatus Rokuibacteriota bacterium]|nr:MAG: hypothetical protein DMD81_13010 [Candidatus Rokubacteria bacterium]
MTEFNAPIPGASSIIYDTAPAEHADPRMPIRPASPRKIITRRTIVRLRGAGESRKPGYRVAEVPGGRVHGDPHVGRSRHARARGNPGSIGRRDRRAVRAPRRGRPIPGGRPRRRAGARGHRRAGPVRRLACDASRVVMRHDANGNVTEIGARTRTIPPALRRALQHRDQGCRFPGCGLPFIQGHHIQHWANGGPTTLSNLASLCRRHHRAVHEDGYQIDREPDGTLTFRRPDGRRLPMAPSAVPVAGRAVQALRARHEFDGVHIDARTSMPGWLGERLDVGWAIDVLHPLATG